MATILKFYFLFRFWLYSHHQHVIPHRTTKFYPKSQLRTPSNYLHTKFRQRSSIRGWDIAISGFWKQMAVILKFYSRFRFWPFHCHRHVILHWLCKLDDRRQSYDVISIFQDGSHTVANLLPIFDLVTYHVSEGQ